MKKLLVIVFLSISILSFSQKPPTKKEQTYKWGNLILTSKQYDDTLSAYFDRFSDSLKKIKKLKPIK
jgi:hypothetical protein